MNFPFPTDLDLTFSAWLEFDDERIELRSSFCIGRSTKCEYFVDDNKISRRHSLIQFNPNDKSWLISDLGSKNGVYVNDAKIVQPVALIHDDEIKVGDACFVFHTEQNGGIDQAESLNVDKTLTAIDVVPCWILLADVKGSTRLTQEIPQSELSKKIQIWAKECEEIIQHSEGVLNEYMGDGILAFWYESRTSHQRIIDMLKAFHALESRSGLEFRILLHHGILQIGGGVSSGLEKLAGKELNYAFRLEKPAGQSGKETSLTQAAMEQLKSELSFRELGQFELKGFADQHDLYEPVFEQD